MFIKFLFLDFSSIRSKGVIKFPINKDKKLECKKKCWWEKLRQKKIWLWKILGYKNFGYWMNFGP